MVHPHIAYFPGNHLNRGTKLIRVDIVGFGNDITILSIAQDEQKKWNPYNV
jgi:hypothetical protein